jgi:hypothetical protein
MSEAMQRSGAAAVRPGMALFAALAGVLMLCWPALLNGGAFFFPDTTTYLRSADMVVGELTGWESEWSDKRRLYVKAPNGPAAPAAAAPASATAVPAPTANGGRLHPVLLGRSIYYGLTVFPFVALFGSMAAAILQAVFAVLTIWLTLVALGSERSRMPARLLVTTALLAGLTSLPFFVSMLMPDVFAGFAIALAISAVAGWQRLVRWERLCLTALLILSAMAHSSHVLLLVALAGVTLLIALSTQVKARPALLLMAVAACGGIVGEQLFAFAVTLRVGESPVRPPFLTARLIDDGPGFRLLTERCPSIGLEACHYLDRMPNDSDLFLWSPNLRDGVFSTETDSVQRKLARQDVRFAIETFRDNPLGVAAAGARNVARQLVLTDLNLFNKPPTMTEDMTWDAPAPVASEIHASRFGRAAMPVTISRWSNLGTAIAAALFLAAVLLGRTRERDLVRLRAAAGLFLAAVALNATVTGALSKPHDRYNVRVMWVLQLAALAVLAARRDRQYLEQK